MIYHLGTISQIADNTIWILSTQQGCVTNSAKGPAGCLPRERSGFAWDELESFGVVECNAAVNGFLETFEPIE